MKSIIKLSGVFRVEHWRKGKLLKIYKATNVICNQGADHLLDVTFKNGTKEANWYIGLINNTDFSAVAQADTLTPDSKSWTEFESYSGSNRSEWTPTAQSRILSNTSAAAFTISASGTLRGVFISNLITKGGASTILWNATQFDDGSFAISDGDNLQITYTLTVA